MPASFLIVIIYVKAIHYFDAKKIFYTILSSFLLFFLLFAFYIFPNHETLHLSDQKIHLLTQSHPHLKWFIHLIAKWGFSLFYIISERILYELLGIVFAEQNKLVKLRSSFRGIVNGLFLKIS
jgi:AAA family ATP:ADP antiporter